MKSEKANEYLSKCIEIRKLTFCAADIKYAIELAEREVEKRMLEKAVEVFKSVCQHRNLSGDRSVCLLGRLNTPCGNDCTFVRYFIQKMSDLKQK